MKSPGVFLGHGHNHPIPLWFAFSITASLFSTPFIHFPKLLGWFYIDCIFKSFYFEIATESQEVAQIVERDGCVYSAQLPLLSHFI